MTRVLVPIALAGVVLGLSPAAMAQPAPSPSAPSQPEPSPSAPSQPAPSPSTPEAGDTDTDQTGTEAGTEAAPDAAAALPELDELRPPTSPAFSLLGVSPSEVDRPRTPSALKASLGSAIGASAPSSLALEVAPFWLFDHQDTSTSEFARSYPMQLASSVSVNAATNKTTVPAVAPAEDQSVTDLSLGVYAVPYRRWREGICDELGDGPQLTDESLTRAKLALRDVMLAKIEQCATAAPPTQAGTCEDAAVAEYSTAVAELSKQQLTAQTELEAEWTKKLAQCEKAFWTPKTWVVSAAFATAWRFADGAWDQDEYLRSAAWVTGGYEGQRLTFLLLARLQWESAGNDGIEPDLADVGARVVVHRSSYAGSVEAVRRNAIASELDSGFRLALVGDAKVGASWLSVSLGKDYDSTQDESFFALANLQVTMGDPQVKAQK